MYPGCAFCNWWKCSCIRVISQCVLVLLLVFAGSPMTITEGGPNAGNVASKPGGNWRGRAYKSSPIFVKSFGGAGGCVRYSVLVVTSRSRAGVWLQWGHMLS